MVKENIRIFAISINKQKSESDLSYSQESESEVQTTDSPDLVAKNEGLRTTSEKKTFRKNEQNLVSQYHNQHVTFYFSSF